jgi:hypothetical protein
MSRLSAVRGARAIVRDLPWQDSEGDPLDLTGATLSGKLHHIDSGLAQPIDGELTIVDAPAGRFTWALGEDDVAVAGDFLVEFDADYGGGLVEKSMTLAFRVHPDIVLP